VVASADANGNQAQTNLLTFKTENPPPATYTITASAGTGGTISPGGSISVVSGANQTFTITPNTGYQIQDVLVDGRSEGDVSTYTFSNVTQARSIAANFVLIPNSPPAVVSTSPASGATVKSLSTFTVVLSDDVNVDEAKTVISVYQNGASFGTYSRDNSVSNKITLTFLVKPPDGVYRFDITPVDTAGLSGTKVSVQVTVKARTSRRK
jgi:hypothetical protein